MTYLVSYLRLRSGGSSHNVPCCRKGTAVYTYNPLVSGFGLPWKSLCSQVIPRGLMTPRHRPGRSKTFQPLLPQDRKRHDSVLEMEEGQGRRSLTWLLSSQASPRACRDKFKQQSLDLTGPWGPRPLMELSSLLMIRKLSWYLGLCLLLFCCLWDAHEGRPWRVADTYTVRTTGFLSLYISLQILSSKNQQLTAPTGVTLVTTATGLCDGSP